MFNKNLINKKKNNGDLIEDDQFIMTEQHIHLNHPIEAVIFDLGRVLIQVDFTRGLFRHYTSPVFDDLTLLNRLMNDPLFRDFNSGKISAQQMYETVKEKFHVELPYREFVREWCNIFDPMDGMEEVLQQVARRFPVGLLSDIDPLHWEHCRKQFPMLSVFGKPTLSFEIGDMKPAEICYFQAAKNVGKSEESCLFIDDRLQNVQGALKAGMKSLQFTDVVSLKRELGKLGIF